MMKYPIFGRYNPFIDDGVHLALSFMISGTGYLLGMDLVLALFTFLAGYLIDLDHVLNPMIARRMKIDSYKETFLFSSNGYTVKILHGFDISLVLGIVAYILSSDLLFSTFLVLNLFMHEVWDFLVYPFSWKELFLITRIRTRFHPGERKRGKGLFFDLSTEHY